MVGGIDPLRNMQHAVSAAKISNPFRRMVTSAATRVLRRIKPADDGSQRHYFGFETGSFKSSLENLTPRGKQLALAQIREAKKTLSVVKFPNQTHSTKLNETLDEMQALVEASITEIEFQNLEPLTGDNRKDTCTSTDAKIALVMEYKSMADFRQQVVEVFGLDVSQVPINAKMKIEDLISQIDSVSTRKYSETHKEELQSLKNLLLGKLAQVSSRTTENPSNKMQKLLSIHGKIQDGGGKEDAIYKVKNAIKEVIDQIDSQVTVYELSRFYEGADSAGVDRTVVTNKHLDVVRAQVFDANKGDSGVTLREVEIILDGIEQLRGKTAHNEHHIGEMNRLGNQMRTKLAEMVSQSNDTDVHKLVRLTKMRNTVQPGDHENDAIKAIEKGIAAILRNNYDSIEQETDAEVLLAYKSAAEVCTQEKIPNVQEAVANRAEELAQSLESFDVTGLAGDDGFREIRKKRHDIFALKKLLPADRLESAAKKLDAAEIEVFKKIKGSQGSYQKDETSTAVSHGSTTPENYYEHAQGIDFENRDREAQIQLTDGTIVDTWADGVSSGKNHLQGTIYFVQRAAEIVANDLNMPAMEVMQKTNFGIPSEWKEKNGDIQGIDGASATLGYVKRRKLKSGYMLSGAVLGDAGAITFNGKTGATRQLNTVMRGEAGATDTGGNLCGDMKLDGKPSEFEVKMGAKDKAILVSDGLIDNVSDVSVIGVIARMSAFDNPIEPTRNEQGHIVATWDHFPSEVELKDFNKGTLDKPGDVSEEVIARRLNNYLEFVTAAKKERESIFLPLSKYKQKRLDGIAAIGAVTEEDKISVDQALHAMLLEQYEKWQPEIFAMDKGKKMAERAPHFRQLPKPKTPEDTKAQNEMMLDVFQRLQKVVPGKTDDSLIKVVGSPK